MRPLVDAVDAVADRAPRLIALDWGTSTLRAYLLGAEGEVLESRSEPWGIMHLPGGGYEAAFEAITREWTTRRPSLRVVASGMVGSAQGWVDAPYRTVPAGAAELAGALVEAGGGRLLVVPGIVQRGHAPNVMRGEETQIVGALAGRPALRTESLLVLPGTHSKWVRVADGRVREFTTSMTGELFAVLSSASILGRLARDAGRPLRPEAATEAFARGTRAARESPLGITPLLFSARAAVLTGELAAEASLEYLSGLLIGDELRCGLAGGRRPDALIGDQALCERYLVAFESFGVGGIPVIGDSAPAGIWEIAQHASVAGPTAASGVA